MMTSLTAAHCSLPNAGNLTLQGGGGSSAVSTSPRPAPTAVSEKKRKSDACSSSMNAFRFTPIAFLSLFLLITNINLPCGEQAEYVFALIVMAYITLSDCRRQSGGEGKTKCTRNAPLIQLATGMVRCKMAVGILWGLLLGIGYHNGFLLISAAISIAFAYADEESKPCSCDDSLSCKRAQSHVQKQFLREKAKKAKEPNITRQEAQPQLKALVLGRKPVEVTATSFDLEVDYLIQNIAPTVENDKIVQHLVKMVQQAVSPVVPEAVVRGHAAANIWQVGCTGLKAEVEIVVTCDPAVLSERLRNSSGPYKNPLNLLPDVLQKTATRMLSEKLTMLKFWRSAFRGPEPKVVLLAPPSLGIFDEDIRVHFSVNTPHPLRMAEVYKGRGAPREKALLLFVNRWAHDRCVSNTAKGHLHPYAWSLLVVHFFQAQPRQEWNLDESTPSTGSLFKEFVDYCVTWLDDGPFPHAITFFTKPQELDISSCAPIHLEDPFEPGGNAAGSLNSAGYDRLREEFQRAKVLLSHEPRLADLLVRWTPEKEEETSHSEGKRKKANKDNIVANIHDGSD